MGRVLHFQAPARPAQEATENRTGAMCQILFFTGVRYERHAEPQHDPQQPDATTRRRTRRRSA
ncbi:hypothetical protein GCM10007036_12620 [Alsobacter metallidurans]|uniref:Uncharacterized protein n=1 Tax=Alsobacter metallidurans TaxID=340221 RepID=A0A917I5Q9_9HYPH|nr:hypothetical protein [Alsobacter metallidurans]GGH13771.1 hypothetical protein GCM10007036_12620 [Alsobacter metallidurans]